MGIIEEQYLSASIIRKLRKENYQVLEELTQIEYDELSFLNTAEKVELICYLDKKHLRLKDCSNDIYPNIDDYFKQYVKCEGCGASLDAPDWSREKRFCQNCVDQRERLTYARKFEVEFTKLHISKATPHNWSKSSVQYEKATN